MKRTNILFTLFTLVLASSMTRAQAQTNTLEVWGHDLEMTADGSTITHLTISERDVVDYTAFNMVIMVPKGIHVARVRQGRDYVDDISLNEDRATTTHTIACNMPEADYIKVASYFSKSQDYYPDDIDGNPVTELFTIGLTADATMANGEYEIYITGVKFVLAKGGASVPQAPITMKMTVTGGVDGKQVTCTVGEAGVSTLLLPYDAHIPSALSAYTCSEVDGTQLVLSGQVRIPALTPVLLMGEPGTYTFTGVPEATEETAFTTGVMTGVLSTTQISEGYVLQNQDNGTAFYPVNPTRPVNVPAHKCYVNWTGKAQLIRFDGSTTDIEAPTTSGNCPASVYDMGGRRVTQPTSPGVYIRGNKKMYIKK